MLVTAQMAAAQAPTERPQPRPINLTMEQRHIIKEIILKEMKVAPTTADVPTKIGEAIPSGVPLQPIPVEVSSKIPQMKTHSFVVKGNTVLIVDPENNKIAEAVE